MKHGSFFTGRTAIMTLCAALAGAAFVACGAGSNGPVAGVPLAAIAPAAVPTLAPASVSTSVPLAANTAQVVPVPASVGVSGSFSLPAALALPPSTSMSFTASSTTPTGSLALSAARRRIQDATAAQITVLLYEAFTFSNPTNTPVSYPSYPVLSFTLPSFYQLAVGNYYVAFFDGSTWQRPITGTGTVSGQTISFAAPAGAPTYQTGRVYAFALYYQPFAAPTPAPIPSPSLTPATAPSAVPSPSATPHASPAPSIAPSATPTPTPTPIPTPGAVVANPLRIDLAGINATANLTLSQEHAAPTFTITAASCTPSGAAPTPYVTVTGTSPTFTVTANAVGSCSLTATGANGLTTNIPVTVTTLSVGAQ